MQKVILLVVSMTLLFTLNSAFAQDMFRQGKIIDLKIETTNDFYVQMYDPNNGWPLKGLNADAGAGKVIYATALAAKINNSTVKIYYSYPPAGSPFCLITAIQVIE